MLQKNHTKFLGGRCYKRIILSLAGGGGGEGVEVLQKNHTKFGGGVGVGVEVLQKNHTKLGGG